MWPTLLLLACTGNSPSTDSPTTDTGSSSMIVDSGDTAVTDSVTPPDSATTDTAPLDADQDGWPADQDCDDSDPAVSPGAEEICRNGQDDDCDGTIGSCGWPELLATDAADAALYGTEERDLVGTYLALLGDTDGDGTPEWSSWHSGSDGHVVVEGLPLVTDALTAHGSAALVPEIWLWPLIAAGDVDGDGLDDVWGGQPRWDDTGRVALLAGPLAGALDLTGVDQSLVHTAAGERFGTAVVSGIDLTGDGLPDVASSAPDHQPDGSSTATGVVFLFDGPLEGSRTTADATGVIVGPEPTSWWGSSEGGLSLVAGDLDADGIGDLVVGAPEGSAACDCAPGQAWLQLGPLDAVFTADDADATWRGTGEDDGVGYSLTGPGDVNADGYDDLWVGAPYSRGARLALFLGPMSGELVVEDGDAVASPDLRISPAAVGDLDGDGRADLAGVVDELPNTSRAAVLVMFSAPSGTLDESAADLTLAPPGDGESIIGLLAPGDLDGDGNGELLIGLAGWREPEQAGVVLGFLGHGW